MGDRTGQLFVCGFDGTRLPAGLEQALAAGDCGGVILFSRNIESPAQLAALTQRVFEVGTPHRPWICVDQEGGRVARLRAPFTVLPPAAVLGALDDVDESRRYARILGDEAAAAGFNIIFAPVLDVHSNAANPVIGDRALSGDPAAVGRLGIALAAGLREASVMPCGKHFPGHGDTSQDSHETLPVVAHDRYRLEAVELRPFRQALAAGLPALMTAHVLYPALDADVPATLSPRIIGDLLRGEWGFDGLVFSDDVEMKAVSARYAACEIVIEGLGAGVDQFLVCRQWELLPGLIRSVDAAVEVGRLQPEVIAKALSRIGRAKAQYAAGYRGVGAAQIEAYLAAVAEHHGAMATRFAAAWLAARASHADGGGAG
ncbi:MAG: beta-N-acetylhexosaminidase [Candidatus Schekmanbacteria bacterium]|nr:beta-N-acetylhexosaminidase [Candidatus Schekmanbacteria bacterium]